MMLFKLQKKTVVKTQLFGYTITLLIGVFIILSTVQLFIDTKPLLNEQTDVFNSKSVVISKQVSVFKTVDKEKIYFTTAEIQELERQVFVKKIAKFNNANFKIKAYSNKSENIPIFYTDLFFESIPDNYLDIKPEEWKWNALGGFVPIIIPESYLKLYNFGFAESQGLPVLSKNTISQISFKIRVSGNNKTEVYNSKIVGFSNKINSILVPESFLSEANKVFGRVNTARASRVLVEFNNPTDERILKFFNQKNYAINKEKLEFSKLTFFFKSALFFVILIAVIIIVLSIAFILLSFNLIFQKNKILLINLYSIGYTHQKIAKFYQLILSVTTVISVFIAILLSNLFRSVYLEKFQQVFDFSKSGNKIIGIGIFLMFLLVLLYNVFLIIKIKRIVIPSKSN